MIKNIIIVVLSVLLALCLVNYAVDFAFYLKNRYCRFHIGRRNEDAWRTAVLRRAVSWLKRTPTVKITDNSRYMLLDMFTGKYRSGTIQSWQKAALILGVLDFGGASEIAVARAVALNLLDPNGRWKNKPEAVDCGMLACSVMASTDDAERIRPAMEETLSVMRSQVSQNGFLSYTGGPENPELYVDTLGLACPFLCMYAKVYHEPAYEELAFSQLEYYHRYGIYPGTMLPNHAVNSKSKLPAGVFGWGRGTGWYVIGLVDSLRNTQSPERRKQLLAWIREAANEYGRFQREDGGFGSTLQRESTYDSSATAVLAWFYAKCYRLFGISGYRSIAEKCLQKLRTVTRLTGAIDWCQGDTKEIGVFAQTYDIMPFAQGMALRALHEMQDA